MHMQVLGQTDTSRAELALINGNRVVSEALEQIELVI